MPQPKPKPRTAYLALVGLSYGSTNREPGDVVDDLPAQSVGWLLEQGWITEDLDAVVPAVPTHIVPTEVLAAAATGDPTAKEQVNAHWHQPVYQPEPEPDPAE